MVKSPEGPNLENNKKENLVFRQTEGGMYNSAPDVRDVLDDLGIKLDEYDWRKEAMDRGHGEYVANVEQAVKFAKEKGLKTKEEIEIMLDSAEWERG